VGARVSRAARLLAVALLLGACSDDGDAAPTTTAELDERGLAPEMAAAVDEAEAAFLAAYEAVAGTGLTRRFANVDLAGCEDRGRMKVPHPSGRLDRPDSSGGTLEDAVAIRDLLADEGFRPVESSRFTDGIDAADDRWSVSVDDGEVSVRISLWSDRPYVLVDAVGRCLPVTEEERVRYNALGSWELDVGA
jgi:hypothetical protein